MTVIPFRPNWDNIENEFRAAIATAQHRAAVQRWTRGASNIRDAVAAYRDAHNAAQRDRNAAMAGDHVVAAYRDAMRADWRNDD
jgi:hypothetical protein